MANNERFETMKTNYSSIYHDKKEKLKEIEGKLKEAQSNGDTKKVDLYTRRVNNLLASITNIQTRLSSMRPHTDEDLEERTRIFKTYAQLVDQSIPDDVPVVFHGNNNIGMIKKIIESGGLFTPEERGVDFKSFATQIDVTAKTNIQVSLEFAESSTDLFMPYGAIFVFYPKEHEYEKVLSTGKSTEVFGGVESIRFDEDRFVGIITTGENVEGLRTCMSENGLNPNKVFTHQQFLDMCKEIYPTSEHKK
ncbi:MAG: hypothetical protein IKQ35_02420 [Bacilli bacterium]|nr:hypothetical protein [Bacilli bacterium]